MLRKENKIHDGIFGQEICGVSGPAGRWDIIKCCLNPTQVDP